MRKSVFFVYLVCLHLLVAALVVKSGLIGQARNKLGIGSTADKTFVNKMLVYHKRMDGSVPDGAVIFIGDSIIQALPTAAVTDLSINYSIGTDTTVGALNRISTYESIDRSKAVVLAIGVNDLRRRSVSDIRLTYKNILDSISVDTPIIVNAILPVGMQASEKYPTLTNARISQLNAELESLLSEYQNTTFIDMGKQLKDEQGRLKGEFHIGDGVHLSTAGYELVIAGLKKAISSLQ